MNGSIISSQCQTRTFTVIFLFPLRKCKSAKSQSSSSANDQFLKITDSPSQNHPNVTAKEALGS